MFGFFHRLMTRYYAPEIESLRTQLKLERDRAADADEDAQFWHDMYHSEKAEHNSLKEDFKKEINSNRKREDALRNQNLAAAGRPSLPTRETLLPLEEEKTADDALTTEEKEIITSRAEEICIQEFGANFTKDQYDRTLQTMLKEPSRWLSD